MGIITNKSKVIHFDLQAFRDINTVAENALDLNIKKMIYYILGVITGIIIMAMIVVIHLLTKPAIDRILNQTASKFKEKGKIIEQKDEEIEDWINNLKQD